MNTEEQFTTAMRAAVAERGANWCYPKFKDVGDNGGWYNLGVPTYSNHAGEATCLIGKAMELAGMQVPYLSSGGAITVLDGLVPKNVAVAARSAQAHQDYSRPWGEALAIYEWVAENYDGEPGQITSSYHRACEALGIKAAYPESAGIMTEMTLSVSMQTMVAQADAAMKQVVESMKQVQAAVEEANELFTEEVEAVLAQPVTPPKWYSTPSAANLPIVGFAKGGVTFATNTYVTGGPIFQKDHALVA